MSNIPTGDPGKPMKQSFDDLTKTMAQLSVTTGNSDNTSTQPKNLPDMPIDVVGLIIERSDYKEQLKLRKVSKHLRALVDRQKPGCKTLKLDYRGGKVVIFFNSHRVDYSNYSYKSCCSDVTTTVKSEDFKKVAFADLASTLINPKLQLENLMISDIYLEKTELDEYYNEIQRVFESLNHQVSVKEIKFKSSSPSCLLSILPYVKSGVLEKIALSFDHRAVDWRIDSTEIDKVALLDQWKQAEELEFWNQFDVFPMKYATHFKRLRFNECDVNGNKFTRIIDFLSKSNNFEQFTLSCIIFHFKPGLVYQWLGAPVSKNTTEEVFHRPIPNSDYYFEIKKATKTFCLDIKKKKRGIHC